MSTPVVDESVLGPLAERLGDGAGALLASLHRTWDAETTARLQELERAVAAGDGEAVGRAAHAIKGGSASMGAARLAAVCGELEQAVRDGAPLDLEPALERVRAAVAQAREALAALYGS